MNFQLKTLARKTVTALHRRAPEILTGFGISGMLTTTVLAVWATPEALRRIEQQKRAAHEKKLTVKETIQTTWKCYLPAAVTGSVSIGCLIGASAVNGRRNAALATAYTLAESTLRDYRSHVVETLGEKKEALIQEAVDQDRIAKNPPPANREALIAEGTGQTLCYDAMFGRYFYSDRNQLERAVNKLNRQMATMSEPYVSLNDFYREIDLSEVDVGDDLGWNVDNGMIELRFSSQLANGHIPCLVVSYTVAPYYNYF